MSTKHPSLSPASGEKKGKAIILEMKFKIIAQHKGSKSWLHKLHEIFNIIYKTGFALDDFAQLWANISVLNTFKVG